MDEMEEGKQKFLEVVKGTDAAVQVVISVTPSNSMFLISLTKGPNRKFITIFRRRHHQSAQRSQYPGQGDENRQRCHGAFVKT